MEKKILKNHGINILTYRKLRSGKINTLLEIYLMIETVSKTGLECRRIKEGILKVKYSKWSHGREKNR
jgi:predicted transcriptional regulator